MVNALTRAKGAPHDDSLRTIQLHLQIGKDLEPMATSALLMASSS